MASRDWPALELRFPLSLAPSLLAALDDCTLTALDEQESACWRVFFATRGERNEASRNLVTALEGRGLQAKAIEVSDEDWAARSQAALQAIRIGRIVIAPPWDETDTHGGAHLVRVVVEPSTGFGTGHHPSTRLCIKWLQRLDLRGKTVIDVGTGSGVLAVVADCLGARRVIAADRDELALQAARDTFARNEAHRVELRLCDLSSIAGERCDVLLANLTAPVLARRASELAALVGPGGSAILAGLTIDEEDIVRAAFSPALVLRGAEYENEWVALRLKGVRNASP